MRIYMLSDKGTQLARSVNAPRSPSWNIIYYLDKKGKADDDEIALKTGMDRGLAVATLSVLKKNGVVMEA